LLILLIFLSKLIIRITRVLFITNLYLFLGHKIYLYSDKNACLCLIIKTDFIEEYVSIGKRNVFAHCWRHVKFRNILLLRLVKHIGEYSIRKYSPSVAPRSFSSRPRLRAYPVDVTSCQEKGSTRIIKGVSERRRRHRRRRFSDAAQCELYIQQTLFNHAPSCPRFPAFPKFVRRGRSYVSCLLSAQFKFTSSSGVLRHVLHRLDEIFRETCLCLRRVK